MLDEDKWSRKEDRNWEDALAVSGKGRRVLRHYGVSHLPQMHFPDRL